jgi:hypothetical protein
MDGPDIGEYDKEIGMVGDKGHGNADGIIVGVDMAMASIKPSSSDATDIVTVVSSVPFTDPIDTSNMEAEVMLGDVNAEVLNTRNCKRRRYSL